MSTQVQKPSIEMPDCITSSNGKLVYFYLKTYGETTVERLREALDIKLLTLYSVLNSLKEEGIVTTNGNGKYRCID